MRPGQTARNSERGGRRSRRAAETTPSTAAPTSSLPSVSAPGEKRPPAERIPTNAEAQSTTVTSAASDAAALPCIPASSVHDVSVQAEASMRHPPTMSIEHRHLGDVDIAAVAALLGEPARAAMLDALMDGGIRPAGELARCAGIAPSTASGHLMRL